MNEYITELTNVSLFNGILKDNIRSILTCLGSYVRTYTKGEFISLSDESVNYVGIVLNGIVHMLKEDSCGNKTIIVVIKNTELFGETFACASSFPSTVSFFSASKTQILFMPFDKIMRSCSSSCVFHHKLIKNMVTLISNKNIYLMEKLEILSKRTLRDKILTYLSLQAQRHKNKYFQIPMGRIELADYLCVNRSALTRELSNMKADGLIDFDKNTFRLI